MQFNAMRLSVARKRARLSKKGFADRLGVTPHTVTRWENGDTQPLPENVRQFSLLLNFPEAFFFQEDLEIADASMVSFRSQKSMTASERDAALAAGAIGFSVSDWVEKRFNLPDPNVPDLNLYDPEMAAVILRQDWGLGEEPISNMVHLLESRGVRVFSLAEDTRRVNAFSLWRGERPYVFLNTMKTAENSRFDAAHELGHLVLHQDGKNTGRSAEDEANLFAAAFLMPKADVLAQFSGSKTLTRLIALKKRWRVSLMALIVRLGKLGLITEWVYRDLCIQVRMRYKDTEPEGIERERSVVWQKVMKSLWAERVTQLDIARDLGLPEAEVSGLIFGILQGAGDSPEPTKGTRPRLVSGGGQSW